MVNQRRRRAVIVGVTLVFVLLAQTPNLVINVWIGRNPHESSALDKPETKARIERAVRIAHVVVPVLWLPNGARELAEGRWWPALLGAVGAFGPRLSLHRAVLPRRR